jgi:3-phenylpropionate/trans-cinnamate dioxygenase ferredoxin reductase component
MTNYQYLIVGGGMTAAAAADGIREVDSTGAIGLISAEPDAPYNRPPLSKALWKGQPLETIWRKPENKLREIQLGRLVKEIVPAQERVLNDKGNVFTYQKLLLATGGRPRRLPFGDDQIIYFRTLSDYRRLRALTETGRRFAVIGGRVYRFGNRCRAGSERERSGDDLPRQRYWRSRLPARSRSVCV